MKRIKVVLLVLVCLIIAVPLISFFFWNSIGDSPPAEPGWRLKASTERPPCVSSDESVNIRVTESGIRFVRTPDRRFENLPGYPFPPNYVMIDGLRLHYVDEGPKDGEVVLMIHGQPSWSYLYRKMIPVFADAGYRAIAVDLIGMGRSDKPVELGIHTYEQHIKWIKAFIHVLKLENITLFCQDWGGLIGLRMVGDEPQLFSRVVAANTTLPVLKWNPFRVPNPVEIDCEKANFSLGDGRLSGIAYSEYRDKLPKVIQMIVRVVSFQQWILYALTAPDFTPSRIVEFATLNDLSKEEAAAYDAPYPSLIYKAAVRTFPSMIAAVTDNNAAAWDNLGRFSKPFLFLAGVHDKNLGAKANQDLFIKHIPGAKGQPHERLPAHHFIQEDIGEILAEKVVAFMKANPIE